MMKLPNPEEKLAGCCWLPRLAAKTRCHVGGRLPFSYRIAFGSRVGIDGYFLRHFRLSMAQVITAVRSAENEEALATWFLQQPGVSAERIAKWNERSVKLGAAGQRGYITRQIVRWVLYPKSYLHPCGTLFELIAQDEGLEKPSQPPGPH